MHSWKVGTFWTHIIAKKLLTTCGVVLKSPCLLITKLYFMLALYSKKTLSRRFCRKQTLNWLSWTKYSKLLVTIFLGFLVFIMLIIQQHSKITHPRSILSKLKSFLKVIIIMFYLWTQLNQVRNQFVMTIMPLTRNMLKDSCHIFKKRCLKNIKFFTTSLRRKEKDREKKMKKREKKNGNDFLNFNSH